MRLRRPLPHLLAAAHAGPLLAACGREQGAYDRGGVFLQRGTMQRHADGRFDIGLEQSHVGAVTGPQLEFLSGRYALTASDSTLTASDTTLTTEPDRRMITGTITRRRITVRMPVAQRAFERP